ncbi:MAG: hypothetical protein ABIB47_05175 [Candidatus Woesearchaeota archaeon]
MNDEIIEKLLKDLMDGDPNDVRPSCPYLPEVLGWLDRGEPRELTMVHVQQCDDCSMRRRLYYAEKDRLVEES